MGGREYLGCLLALGLMAIMAGTPVLAVLGLTLSKLIGLGIFLLIAIVVVGFLIFSDNDKDGEET